MYLEREKAEIRSPMQRQPPSHPRFPYLFWFRWNREKVSRKGGANKTPETAEKNQME